MPPRAPAVPEALARLSALVDLLPVLPLVKGAAHAYSEIRAELESNGEMIGNNDLWIAAHAVAAGLTLVTNNEEGIPARARVEGAELGRVALPHSCAPLGLQFNVSAFIFL